MTVIERIEPGSSEWLKTMSASKIAAVVGLSKWQSRFSLYYLMAGLVPSEDKVVFERGHILEPAILEWFRRQHPGWDVTRGDSYVHPEHAWATATPDGEAFRPSVEGGRALVEAKTDAAGIGWGRPGTDEIPKGYWAQAQWQMLVTGLDTCYFPMIGAYLEFSEYVVRADPTYQAWLLAEGKAFMDTLPGGPNEQRPNLDDHMSTYETVRKLHPDIDRELEVAVPADIHDNYEDSKAKLEELTNNHRRWKTLLLDVMGNARFATVNGTKVLRRQPGKGGHIALHTVTPPKERDAA